MGERGSLSPHRHPEKAGRHTEGAGGESAEGARRPRYGGGDHPAGSVDRGATAPAGRYRASPRECPRPLGLAYPFSADAVFGGGELYSVVVFARWAVVAVSVGAASAAADPAGALHRRLSPPAENLRQRRGAADPVSGLHRGGGSAPTGAGVFYVTGAVGVLGYRHRRDRGGGGGGLLVRHPAGIFYLGPAGLSLADMGCYLRYDPGGPACGAVPHHRGHDAGSRL